MATQAVVKKNAEIHVHFIHFPLVVPPCTAPVLGDWRNGDLYGVQTQDMPARLEPSNSLILSADFLNIYYFPCPVLVVGNYSECGR